MRKTVPALDRVVVVVMENKVFDRARSGAYVGSLIAQGAEFTNSHAVMNPSQPNYVALWSGSTLGVTSDSCPPPGSPFTAENLGHACESAGIPWRAYVEDLPAPGSDTCLARGGLYIRTHAPWTHFSNLSHANERSFTDLDADLSAGTLPRLAFVVPNNCHNSHNEYDTCGVEVGDRWLSQHVPRILAAVGSRGLVIVTWDEGVETDDHILTVFAGAPVVPGARSNRRITHFTVLRTICDALGLPAFAAAAGESPIVDVWAEPLAGAAAQDPARSGS